MLKYYNTYLYNSKKLWCELSCRRHSVYGVKVVDITYNDRTKLLYYTINIGGRNTTERGRKSADNRRPLPFSCCSSITAQ